MCLFFFINVRENACKASVYESKHNTAYKNEVFNIIKKHPHKHAYSKKY